MHPKKVLWGIRALLYKVRFSSVGLPSYIGRPLYIEGGRKISLGSRVRIFPGIRMEVIGSDGAIEIGDDTYIGQNCHITAEGSTLKIGKHVTILSDIFITNIDHDYRAYGTHVLEQPRITRNTAIGDYSFIGYSAAIQAGVQLGKHCIVGAHAVVNKGVYPDGCVLVGAPAKIVKQYNPETDEWEKVKH